MKYRIKINIPWGKKGEFVSDDMHFSVRKICNGMMFDHGGSINPADFPDLFEEVEEKTDEDLLADDFRRRFNASCFEAFNLNEKGFDIFAKSLLSQNAINPEFIKSLRNKEDE